MEISLTDGSSIPSGDPGSESGGEGNQFGTFGGVFTPSILTILGVVMYLLLPEVTGRLGLFQTLMVVVVAGPFIWAFLEDLVHVPAFWAWAYTVVRYLLALLLLYGVIALLYQWLPNRRLRGHEILPGAAVTVIAWLITASLFSLYLQNLGRFSVTYGSLGGIVVTLMFFYLSAAIFIFGAELNAVWRARTGRRSAPQETNGEGEDAEA